MLFETPEFINIWLFIFAIASRQDLWPTHLPNRWVFGSPFAGGKVADAWIWPITSI